MDMFLLLMRMQEEDCGLLRTLELSRREKEFRGTHACSLVNPEWEVVDPLPDSPMRWMRC